MKVEIEKLSLIENDYFREGKTWSAVKLIEAAKECQEFDLPLVGINLDENNPGYKHFMIRPRTVEQPLSIRGEYATIRGTIVCDWKKVDSKFNITLEIPTNTTATVHVPAKKAGGVREGGKRVKSASHVVFIGMQDGCAVYRVSSGKYSFASVL